jgi:FkbM family methyltransferase
MSLFKLFEQSAKSFVRGIDKKNNKELIAIVGKLPARTSVTLIDIGAAGDIEPRWKKFEPILNYIGFEPDERSRNLLEQKENRCLNYSILPNALWESSGDISINLCRAPQVSSYYFPNRGFVDLFPNPNRFDIESSVSLNTVKLDDLNFSSADFMKVDIQGGELNALRGGMSLLEKTLGLEIEVEFLPIYSNQPLFGEVSEFASKLGFQFIDFVSLIRWQRNSINSFGQCTFADALFLRSPEYVMENHGNDDVIISKYLSICLLYNRFDIIDRVIHLLGEEKVKSYIDFIKAIEPLKRKEKNIIRINSLASKLIRIYGCEYRSHVTY